MLREQSPEVHVISKVYGHSSCPGPQETSGPTTSCGQFDLLAGVRDFFFITLKSTSNIDWLKKFDLEFSFQKAQSEQVLMGINDGIVVRY